MHRECDPGDPPLADDNGNAQRGRGAQREGADCGGWISCGDGYMGLAGNRLYHGMSMYIHDRFAISREHDENPLNSGVHSFQTNPGLIVTSSRRDWNEHS